METQCLVWFDFALEHNQRVLRLCFFPLPHMQYEWFLLKSDHPFDIDIRMCLNNGRYALEPAGVLFVTLDSTCHTIIWSESTARIVTLIECGIRLYMLTLMKTSTLGPKHKFNGLGQAISSLVLGSLTKWICRMWTKFIFSLEAKTGDQLLFARGVLKTFTMFGEWNKGRSNITSLEFMYNLSSL